MAGGFISIGHLHNVVQFDSTVNGFSETDSEGELQVESLGNEFVGRISPDSFGLMLALESTTSCPYEES